MRLRWQEGRLQEALPLPDTISRPRLLVFPAFCEPHAHLDKTPYTRPEHPNLESTMAGPAPFRPTWRGTISARRRLWLIEPPEPWTWRGVGGLRAIRSHVDSLGLGAPASWEALCELRRQWRDRITIQLVAMVPLYQ